MIVNLFTPPPLSQLFSGVHGFERGLDPWHVDAFPDEFKYVGARGKRLEGWYALDWCGNVIGFIADGTVYPGEDI